MSLIILNLQVIEWGRISNYFWVKLHAWRKRKLPLKLGKMNKNAVSLHLILNIFHLQRSNQFKNRLSSKHFVETDVFLKPKFGLKFFSL